MNPKPQRKEPTRTPGADRGRSLQVSVAPLSGAELVRLARIYKVLSDPTRLRIVTALHRRETCVGDLAALTGISESAASHQLRPLKDLALVKSRRAGQMIYYSLDDDHVVVLLDAGMKHIREDVSAGQRPNHQRVTE